MKPLAEIRRIFQADRFATMLGMTVDDVSEERVVCGVPIRDEHRNGMGQVQGGFLFTLADFAFAVAANHERIDTVTLNSTIHFLKSPTGNRLTATVTTRHAGRTVQLYDIEIRDEDGSLVATVASTGYRKTPRCGND